ncbi:uncharacterized protein LOC107025117 [Solanum pennellii]|uniref:Uncharacterized protein LOC107025117 n=1 Tax=Solanum pennellii TaxID=28526 RepID=A0ABM1H7E8_SOLPN|nr:uncharacterized protein LOC107025117 [Solanum pennellii]
MAELDDSIEQQIQSIEGSNIKKELNWREIIFGRTDMLCGKRSTSPKGPDLNYFPVLCLSDILDAINERKIERITREIQEAKEEGLRVDIATAIYKAAAVTLDEDLASQMKRKKDVEMETEDLREKLDTLRLKTKLRQRGDNNEEVSLTDVVVAQPTVAEQNELIMQLMQQIAEMRVETQRRHDLPPPGFASNVADRRPPIYFPSSNMDPTQNQPSTPVHNPSNYQTSQNAQSPSIAPPLPKRATFQIPVPAEHDVHGSELDHYEEQENEWRTKEDARVDINEEIKKAMKELQCIPDVAGLSYEDLCIHPNLDLPEGFKIPKFDTFGEVCNPMAYLRAYCDQLVGVGRDEALLMRLFNRSLCGEALEWFTSHETRKWPSWNALAKDFIDRFAYNVEIVPDRYSLKKMKQKSTESYREFAYRWRNEAARVRPPMTEKEIVEVFVRVQEPEYYDRIRLLVGAKFSEIVKIGETIEDSLKSRKIARVATSPGSSRLLKNKREEVAAISYGGRKTPGSSSYSQCRSRPSPKSYQVYYTQSSHPNNQNTTPIYPNTQAPLYQSPPPSFKNLSPTYPNYPQPYQIPSPYQGIAPNSANVPPPQQGSYDPPQPRFEKRPSRNFTALTESWTKLYEKLAVAGYIHPVGTEPVDVNSKFYKPDQICDYNSNGVGHDTEYCINLKHKIQDLIDQEVVSLQPAAPNVNTNPLSNHGGSNINMIETDEDWCGTKMITPIVHDDLERAVTSLSVKETREFVILTPTKVVALVPSETLVKPKFVIETAAAQGMTRSRRCYTPDKLALGGQKKDQAKRPISEGETEEFRRMMQPKYYSIVKNLEKTPAQISIWALLMSSQSHRKALMKALDDTYVPAGTSSDNVASMIHQVIRGYRINFCDDELPVEGRSHNKALHITVICHEKVVNCVLVDDGSGLNIRLLSTLRQLRFDLRKLEQNQVNVRAFDGVQRDTLGAANLTIQIGPVEFSVQFHVLDINTNYNLLL